MHVEIFEPVVGYGTEIVMFTDSIAAGKGWTQCDERVPVNLGRMLIPHPEMSCIARVTGESMIGVGIYPDDILMIDRAKTPRDGSIVAVNVDGDTLVKRLRLLDGGRVVLESANPLYADFDITEFMSFRVIGTVTSVTRLLE